MKTYAPLLVVGAATVFLVHCATGSVLEDDSYGTGGEGGTWSGSGGDGGTGTTTPSSSSSSSGTIGTGGAGGESMGASSSSTAASSSSAASSSTSSSSGAASSSSSSTSASSSSSSSGGGGTCDPLNPGGVCTASEHCFPQPNGIPTCEGPVGSGGKYSSCSTADDCQAALNCIDTGDIFALPCCLSWCTSAAQCPAGSTCEFLATPVYVGATQYGVCYDGNGGCL